MQIDVSLNLSSEDVKDVIIDCLLKNNGITSTPESIKFNTTRKTIGIGYNEHTETIFTGCTISGCKVKDIEFK